MIAETLLRYIDAKVETMMAQLKQQVKSEILTELKAEIRLDESNAEIIDEVSTKLNISEPKEDRVKSPPASAPESFAPVLTPARNESRSEDYHRELGYQLSNSIWDLAWFTGMEQIGQGGSIIVSILYVLNLVMQASFCIICHRNFVGSAFSEEAMDGLNDFRLANAHDYRFYDKIFGKSMIQHICRQDAVYAQNLMVYGARQLEVLNTVKDYLDSESDSFLSLFAGQYMCLLALACWTLCVLRQLKNIWFCIAALVQIPRWSTTVINRGEMELLGRRRFIFISGIECQQLAICVLLLIYGCIWLSQTSDIQELLLNAAALEFVLSVDEMLFDALAPRSSQAFIESMTPLRVPEWTSCKGIDLFTISRTLLLPVVLIFCYCNLVSPLVAQMQAAQSALCDHDLDFLYGIDQKYMVWIERPSFVGTNTRLASEAQRCLREIIHEREHENTTLVGKLPYAFDRGVSKLSGVVSVSTAAYADLLNRRCIDLLDSSFFTTPDELAQIRVYLHFLRVYTQNFSISTCRDLEQMGVCSKLNHPAITLCSKSCNCKSPVSPVFSHKPTWGCPATCTEHYDYTDAIDVLRPNCTDFPVRDLQASRFWWQWQHQLIGKIGSNLARDRKIADAMAVHGCSAILFDPGFARSYCEGFSMQDLRPLSPLCPQICRCWSGVVRNCARQCSSSTTTAPSPSGGSK